MGISAILGIGKANAQNNTSHDSVVTSHIAADIHRPHFLSDSVNIDMLLTLNDTAFLDTVKSDDNKTDMDAIFGLPPEERTKVLAAAKARPLRIEIDTVTIKNNKEFNNLAAPIAYINSLNMIRLVQFTPAVGADKDVKGYCNALNKETKFMFIHEYKHYLDSDLDITGLTMNQLAVFILQLEITSRLEETLARRKVFLMTKKITEAFPRETYKIVSELKNIGDIDSVFVSKDPKEKNPLQHHKFRFLNIENKAYMEWLFENRNKKLADSIQPDEAAIIFTTVLRNANIDYVTYFENGQLNNMFREAFVRQNSSLIKKYREFMKAKTAGAATKETAPSFSDLIQKLYTIHPNTLPKDIQFVYTSMIQKLYEERDFQNSMALIKKQHPTAISSNQEIQKQIYTDPDTSQQKFDISDQRNKHFNFSESDINKISKILNPGR